MASAKAPTQLRKGEPLRVGRKTVTFGRNILHFDGKSFALRLRMFVNDPWELLAEAITRAVKPGKVRDIAHSFRRQAEDYFRAATAGREQAVRPVLLITPFRTCQGIRSEGNHALAGTALHGISGVRPKTNTAVAREIVYEAGDAWFFRNY